MKKQFIFLFVVLLLCSSCITREKTTRDISVLDGMVVTKTTTVKKEKIKNPKKEVWGKNSKPKWFAPIYVKRLNPKLFTNE
jgi:hypothetical protein